MTFLHAGDIDIRKLRLGDIDLRDIAHGLAYLSYGGGQVAWWFSIADHASHCELVAQIHHQRTQTPGQLSVLTYRQRLLLLLHDAHEAYLTDVPTPLQWLMPDRAHWKREVDAVLYASLRVVEPTEAERAWVKRVDNLAFAIAARYLLPKYPIEADTPREPMFYISNHEYSEKRWLNRVSGLLSQKEARLGTALGQT